MKALKIALFSAVAIGVAAPAFAQTTETVKPAVSTQAAPPAKSDLVKPSAAVDSKSNVSAPVSTDSKKPEAAPKKLKKHHKQDTATPAKSSGTPAANGKSSS